MDDALEGALEVFIEESRDLLSQMEEILLQAESGDCDAERLNALFRCAHTIKGSGGLFGLDEAVRFTHVVENVLDRLRQGEITFGSELITVLLQSQDQIATVIKASLAGEPDADIISRDDQLIGELTRWTTTTATAVVQAEQEDAVDAVDGVDAVTGATDAIAAVEGGGVGPGPDHWHISLRFSPGVFADGLDPLAFVNYLSNCGEVIHVESVLDHLPDFDSADPESCYLGFEVSLLSQASKKEIESVFDFLDGSATIRIFPPYSRTEEFIKFIESTPEDDARLGDLLIACGTLTAKELAGALKAQHVSGGDTPIGQILAAAQAVQPEVIEAAAAKQKRQEEKRVSESKSIKVPSERLDALINRVGELVIIGAETHARAFAARDPELLEAASQLLSLVEDIRDMSLGLRMVPIGEVFARFPRVVRDVSKELGKSIELEISGSEAELDKSMVEKIGDPLMHLLRNSMDHGIEQEAERIAAGKPPQGRLRLSASHESGAIIVEISDDGRGLDTDKILAKAVEKGLAKPGANLRPEEIHRLIFEPGFSTAEQVSNLSGRGVGLDVVRANVDAMHGVIDIQSQPGQGATMRLCLPLTLAIIDGFHVGVGDGHFIIPLDMVVECVELPFGINNVDYMDLRGNPLPFVRLRDIFSTPPDDKVRPLVVIVSFAGSRVGLVVDCIFGKCQTVIKPLGPLFRNVPAVSGATILGGGEVALIMDIARLTREVVSRESRNVRHGVDALATAGA